MKGTFKAVDHIGGERYDLDFSWIPLSQLDQIKLYPPNFKDILKEIPQDIIHFIYHQ